MKDALRSAFLWWAIATLTAVMFPFGAMVTLVCAMWEGTWHFGHRYARWWARNVIRLNPAWQVEMDARRLPNGHYVIVSNHESVGDIIVDLHLPHHFKFVSKRGNFLVPFMGWAMFCAGYIPLVRGNKDSVERCMRRARHYLDLGVSVLFYAEGTRSRDGQVKAFKPGAFRLAIEAGVPVLPIATTGTRNMVVKNSLRFSSERTPMGLVVGDPIPVDGLTVDDVQLLADQTRDAIRALKGEVVEQLPLRRAAVG
jgi:1-acyl-sn-glycerol-3-phosphate acyltransferase